MNTEELLLISVDVETTGLDPKRDSIIEIGSIKTNIFGKRISEFSMLANPGRKLPDIITEITHITDDMLVDKKESPEVVKEWFQWLENSLCILFTHNAPFDLKFIVQHLRKNNINIENMQAIDTLTWSRAAIKNSKNYQLGTLLEYINFDKQGDLHRATFDSLGSLAIAAYILQTYIKPNNPQEAVQFLVNKSKKVKDWIGYTF